ncbi:MAG TPA: fused MFS/spermidine synthase [Bacteroidota bacterium]|nr:fused MFS/spermidine synthase [Bacteroidota bacterium]
MKHSFLKAILALLFAVSGMAGLIYEVTWSKYLSLFMGSTAYSHMIVLATFMGGLALGAWFWGRYADRAANPLHVYALLEIVVGFYCAAYPFLISVTEKLFILTATGLGLQASPAGLTLIKVVLSTATLLLPTFCMGGTLPVLLKVLTRSLGEAGRDIATLYWVNSFGAVIGAALGGFFLIQSYTLDGATWIAAAVNLVVGTVALLLARKRSAAAAEEEEAGAAASEKVQNASSAVLSLAIIVAAMSGFISMIYELTWIRLLITLLGSSTYAFTLMLIAFISGIALGGWVIARIIVRRRRLLRLLAVCQFAAAIFMLGTLPFYQRLPFWLWKLSTLLSNTPKNFPLFLFFEFIFCFLLMIVPTTFSGMSLPIVGKIAAGELKALGRNIGSVFSINTVGAVAGALLTGLVFIPLLGVKHSFELALVLNALLGMVILFTDTEGVMPWKVALLGVLVLLGWGYVLAVPQWSETVSSLGVYRAFFQTAPDTYQDFLDGVASRTTLWYKEGVTANVAVSSFVNNSGVAERALIINGKADATTQADLPTQVLLAQIPLSLTQDTGSVLVIGMGSGITSGSALTHPLRSLDCVEIAPEVVDCDYLFADANGHFLQDPRVHLFIDDAITFVKINPKRYSCIISEPSNPWIAGIGNLFTSEFFELMKQHLAKGGILAQWFHTYELNDEVFELVLRTLSHSFPHVMIWMPTDLDVILTASTDPIVPRLDQIADRFRRTPVADDLSRIKISNAAALLSTQAVANLDSSVVPLSGPLNSEKRPLLEFLAPISFFSNSDVTLMDRIDRRYQEKDTTLVLSKLKRERKLGEQDYAGIANFQASIATDDFRLAVNSAQAALAVNPDNVDAISILSVVAKQTGDTLQRLATLGRLAELKDDNPSVLSTYAMEFFDWKWRTDSAHFPNFVQLPEQLLRRSIDLSEGQNELFFLDLGRVLRAAGNFQGSADAYGSALQLRDKYEPMDASVTDEQLAALAADGYLTVHDAGKAAEYIGRLREIDSLSAELPALMRRLTVESKGRI